MRNTKKQGKFTLFVYPEKPKHFIGVCLEFDLIQEGKNVQEAMENIKKATWNYLKTIIKKKWPDDLLNRPAPREYWKKYKIYLNSLKKREEEKKRLMWQEILQQYLYTPSILKKKSINV